jgi:molecular chaperone GrpE
MTEQQLHKVFKKFGIEKYRPDGDKFNPAEHQALMQTPHDTVDKDHVAVVIKSGFRIKDKVLRPADVGVSTGAPQ